MRKRTVFFAVSVTVIIIVAGVFVLREDGEQAGLSAEEIAWLEGVGANGANKTDKGDTPRNGGADTKTATEPDTAITGGVRRFQHPRLGFTLELPEGFSAGIFEEEESGTAGETTLVRGPDAAELQIYATAFDEEGPLTAERIHKDLPTLSIVAPQQVVLHGGMTALAFLGENETLGKTQEVWFVHDRFLYQLTTVYPMGEDMAKVIGTMRF